MLPLLVQLFLSQPWLWRAHQNSRIPGGMRAFAHILVNLGDVFKAAHFSKAGIDYAVAYQLVVGVSLRVVGAMRALQPLLARPVVAQIDHGGVAGGAGANHDHAALFADENGGRDGFLAGMFKHDSGAAALAQDVPDLLAEGPGALRPFFLALDIGPV